MWDNDKIQFARLLDEIAAAGGLDDEFLEVISESADLSTANIAELFTRASAYWDYIKANKPLSKPLTVDEACARAEHGMISGVVEVDINVFVRHDLDGVLDELGEFLVDGGSCLCGTDYTIVGQQGNTLLVDVSGDIVLLLDQDDY